MSRAETDNKETRANKAKLQEEKRLWTEKNDEEEEEEEKKAKGARTSERARGKQQRQTGPDSPESGIFFEEDLPLTTRVAPRGGGGLVRSATTANISEVGCRSQWQIDHGNGISIFF